MPCCKPIYIASWCFSRTRAEDIFFWYHFHKIRCKGLVIERSLTWQHGQFCCRQVNTMSLAQPLSTVSVSRRLQPCRNAEPCPLLHGLCCVVESYGCQVHGSMPQLCSECFVHLVSVEDRRQYNSVILYVYIYIFIRSRMLNFRSQSHSTIGSRAQSDESDESQLISFSGCRGCVEEGLTLRFTSLLA